MRRSTALYGVLALLLVPGSLPAAPAQAAIADTYVQEVTAFFDTIAFTDFWQRVSP